MTELQKKEFEMLEIFTEICEKLQLRYFLVCGSVIGAVKYGGFIPWDDDIDVALPREDYERFIREAQALLPEHIFLQNYKTDPAFPLLFSKLRNSETTYIEKSVAHLPIHHGIYLDVFPLDGYPASAREAKKLERKKTGYLRKISCVYHLKHSWKGKLFTVAMRALGYHKRTNKTVAKLERLISRYPLEGSELWCNHGNWQGVLEYAPAEQYGKGTQAQFEGLPVTIPENYDAYLTQKYGNWRADLPEEEKEGHHYYTVCDVARPYTSYLTAPKR